MYRENQENHFIVEHYTSSSQKNFKALGDSVIIPKSKYYKCHVVSRKIELTVTICSACMKLNVMRVIYNIMEVRTI